MNSTLAVYVPIQEDFPFLVTQIYKNKLKNCKIESGPPKFKISAQ